METKDLDLLGKGELIDEAADSIELLARSTRMRPEYYRNLVARLRKIATEVEVDDGTSPKDFKKAYDALGGAPDSLNHFIEEVDRMQLGESQMPPPDHKIEPVGGKRKGRKVE